LGTLIFQFAARRRVVLAWDVFRLGKGMFFLVDGRWLMVDRLVDGGWWMVDSRASGGPRPSTIHHRPSTIDHRPSTINPQLYQPAGALKMGSYPSLPFSPGASRRAARPARGVLS
jgi:hypothetical protein